MLVERRFLNDTPKCHFQHVPGSFASTRLLSTCWYTCPAEGSAIYHHIIRLSRQHVLQGAQMPLNVLAIGLFCRVHQAPFQSLTKWLRDFCYRVHTASDVEGCSQSRWALNQAMAIYTRKRCFDRCRNGAYGRQQPQPADREQASSRRLLNRCNCKLASSQHLAVRFIPAEVCVLKSRRPSIEIITA